MLPLLRDKYANASGVYSAGVYARGIINDARHFCAQSLKAYDKEIIFTSGGAEADTLAIKGVLEANPDRGRHIITTGIEHHAVLEAAGQLRKLGYQVSVISAGKDGRVDPADIEAAITSQTALISVMFANNELGTIQPIREIGLIAKRHDIIFHTDAVQAYGKLQIIPDELNIDLLSASAHKFNGPKGAGFLYVRRGIKLKPLINGGTQEYGFRGGTENVAAIAGMACAAKVAFEKMDEYRAKEMDLKQHFLDLLLLKDIEGVSVNASGDKENSLPGIVSVSFEGIEGASLLIMLDIKGIAASSGSACAQSLEAPSHVLLDIGLSEEQARSTLRFSFNHENTMEEIEYIVETLKESVDYLRMIRG